MSKYIDAEGITSTIRKVRTKYAIESVFGINLRENAAAAGALEAVAQVIDILPAADVQEVRHGRWEDNTPTTDEYGNPLSMVADPSKYIDLTCSVCGRKATIKTDYCPNCGAKMDEGGDTE